MASRRGKRSQYEQETPCSTSNVDLVEIIAKAIKQSSRSSAAVIPDLLATLEEFNGEGSPAEAEAWIRSVENVGKLHGWEDAVFVEAAKRKFRGAAKFWLRSVQDKHEWSSFRTAFRKSFVGTLTASQKWQRFIQRAQTSTETTILYFYHKISLGLEAEVSFDTIKEELLVGLSSHDLARYLQVRDHRDVDDIVADVRGFEELDRRRNGNQAVSQGLNITPKTVKTDKTVPTVCNSENPKTTDSTSSASKSSPSPRCYNCNEHGHISVDCPKEKRSPYCTDCKVEGHRRKTCPKAQPSSNEKSTEKKTPKMESVSLIELRESAEATGRNY